MNVIIFDRLHGHARELNLAHPKAIAVIALSEIEAPPQTGRRHCDSSEYNSLVMLIESMLIR